MLNLFCLKYFKYLKYEKMFELKYLKYFTTASDPSSPHPDFSVTQGRKDAQSCSRNKQADQPPFPTKQKQTNNNKKPKKLQNKK